MADKGTENPGDRKMIRGVFLPFASIIAMLGIVVTLFALWSYATYGDLRSGWFRLEGYHLIAEQYLLDLGTVSAGESKSGTFRLKNFTGSPIVILGVQSDCSCLTTAELPIAIPGDAVFDFEILFLANYVDSETAVARQMILNLSVDQPIQMLVVDVTIVPNN